MEELESEVTELRAEIEKLKSPVIEGGWELLEVRT